ncbi:MAG: hypothetical protein JSV00_06680 [bacterium]|nr:MAG: hypothetical protein JSV00_06680 [bacterium]
MSRWFTRRSAGISSLILLTVIAILAGCTGVIQQAYYKGPLGMRTEGMVPVKDDAKKFDFMLPAGWIEVPGDEPLPGNLELPRHHMSEYGKATYRKGDRGSMFLFCRIYGNTDYLIEQSLYEISPSAVAEDTGGLQIKSSGWDPVFYEYTSSVVEKGEKKGFTFLFGQKSQGTFSLFNCDYIVLARSSSLENTEEIKDDFIAVLRSLRN